MLKYIRYQSFLDHAFLEVSEAYLDQCFYLTKIKKVLNKKQIINNKAFLTLSKSQDS